MTTMTTLTSALLDLLKEIEGARLPLIMGGGFGIYLRYQRMIEERRTSMFSELPEPRSTNDMDLFLRAELLMDSSQLKPLRTALTTLGYEVMKGAEHYQFVRIGRDGDIQKGIKIDVLTGSTKPFRGTPVKFDGRRVRPKPSIDLHAHPCEEALTLTEGAEAFRVRGPRSDGTAGEGEVFLPHPFTFLTMKLYALRDQINDPEKAYGRHHALDLYTVVGTMIAKEWEECLCFRARYSDEPVVQECGRIVNELFSRVDAMGSLRLRESAYFRPEFQITEFLGALRELFTSRK